MKVSLMLWSRFSFHRSSKEVRQRPFKDRVTDFCLGFFGLLLAAASGYFPYYVYSNSEDFEPPKMLYVNATGEGGEPVRVVQKPQFLRGELDHVVTGAISEGTRSSTDENISNDQSHSAKATKPRQFSSNIPMELVFASRGRALIRIGEDVLPVAVGSKLPDGSFVHGIQIKNGLWQLETTRDRVLLQR